MGLHAIFTYNIYNVELMFILFAKEVDLFASIK